VPGDPVRRVYLAYSAWADARGAHGNVNHSAHFWGAAFGIAFALVVEPRLIGIFTDRLLAPLG
jgi:membrane associated rhomboid family serine protease